MRAVAHCFGQNFKLPSTPSSRRANSPNNPRCRCTWTVRTNISTPGIQTAARERRVYRHDLTCFHAPAGKPFCQRRSSIAPACSTRRRRRAATRAKYLSRIFSFCSAVRRSRRSGAKADDRWFQINQSNLRKPSHKASKPQTINPYPFLLPCRKAISRRSAQKARATPARVIGPLARKIWIIIRIASKHFRPKLL